MDFIIRLGDALVLVVWSVCWPTSSWACCPIPYSRTTSAIRNFLDRRSAGARVLPPFIPPLGPIDLSPMILLLGMSLIWRAVLRPILGRSLTLPVANVHLLPASPGEPNVDQPSRDPHVRLRRRFFGMKKKNVDRELDRIAESFGEVWRQRADLEERNHEIAVELARHQEARRCCARRSSPPSGAPT